MDVQDAQAREEIRAEPLVAEVGSGLDVDDVEALEVGEQGRCGGEPLVRECETAQLCNATLSAAVSTGSARDLHRTRESLEYWEMQLVVVSFFEPHLDHVWQEVMHLGRLLVPRQLGPVRGRQAAERSDDGTCPQSCEVVAAVDPDLLPQERLRESEQPTRSEADAAHRPLSNAVIGPPRSWGGRLVEDGEEDLVGELGRHGEEGRAGVKREAHGPRGTRSAEWS